MTDYVTQSSTETPERGVDGAGLADTEHLTDTERHGLLASERRRVALSVLAGRSTPVDLSELAATVAARETDTDADDARAVERVAVALHHAHLPKLDDFGVVDYDPEARRVG